MLDDKAEILSDIPDVLPDVLKQIAGKPAKKARGMVVELLQARGFLIKTDDHAHSIGKCYRCRSVVEPYLSPQWFVKTGPLAEPAIKVVEDGSVRIVPKGWENTYFDWMRNIKDWCISRQIWWGHRIPAWYCDDCGTITVSRTDARRHAAKCGSKNLRPGDGCARHLVLLRALALLHARLAGQDQRAGRLLSHVGPDHELRHHLFLGRPHDHDGAPLQEGSSRSRTFTSTRSCATPKARR